MVQKPNKIYRFDELPDVLTLLEAGMLLSYDADYLRKQAIAGKFPAFQLFKDEKNQKGSWRIMKQDLQDWLNRKRAAKKSA